MSSAEGNLTWIPAVEAHDILAQPVVTALEAGAVPSAKAAEIDPGLADTEAFCEKYDVDPAASANCVVVRARRGESERQVAVMVLATDKADINKTIRKHLGARKVGFSAQSDTEAATGMTSGGITPVGLPEDWPVLVDTAVAESDLVVIGGGERGAKLLVPGSELARLPHAEVLDLRVH
jgi:prolyl-tRNA editing enzyme YbaK/EbsC (Cys-tRNA(Pro) deacylase)